MLRIIQNRAAESAKSYYSQADYLSEGQEQIGCWGGKAAMMLGLNGQVTKVAFDRLCDNQHPRTGKQLTPRTRSDRTVGYDFNFHVPKGVSVAYALNQDERIVEAFREAVDETMNELERDMRTRVRRGWMNSERITGNLAWAEFIHHTARPVDGIPDMHLHAHCFVFNQTFDEHENRWKAGQFREIKRDAPYFEAAFHARLAKRLTELGYQIERKGRKWDIAAIPDSVKTKFSRRTGLIEEIAAEEGILRAKDKDKLAAKTREAKQSNLTMDELREVWRSWLTDDERDAIGTVGRSQSDLPEQHATAKALEQAKLHCFERESVVPTRRLGAEALQRGLGHVGVEETLAAIDESDVIKRDYRGRNMATTPAVLAEEQAMIGFARNGKDKSQPLNENWKFKRDWLNKEQQTAIAHLLNSKDRVMLLRGGAGTGKTSLMAEAVEGIEAAGHSVFTFAPSAEASRGVLQSEGFTGATTVAELLINPELQEAARGEVIWIDESGLLGTKTMKQVFDLANRIDARVVLSGDWKQHASVERGTAMRLLEQHAGLIPAETKEIQRQKSRYKLAVAAIATGGLIGGFEQLDRLGWIRELEDSDREQQIAKDYVTSIRKGLSTLVVSPTNAEGEQITRAIRQELRSRKMIGEQDHKLTRLQPKHLTEAERGDAAFYEKGDVIVFQQNATGHRKGERMTIGDTVPDELLELAPRFAVFRAEELQLATKDRIRITANGKTKDGKHRLNNGSVYMIDRFTKSGDVRLTNGWIIDHNYGMFTSGYTSTSHSSQGKTVDHVILSESTNSLPAASLEQFYVSVSRGQKKATIYTDDKSELKRAVRDANVSLSATELQ
ncbi:MAG: relaxase domain-containing protein, partial [Planctomycetales bacterium]|nr:relaxase domain-containing protein [Planctomycetales bacterium]